MNQKKSNIILYLILIFAIIGLLSSVYLTNLHYKTESTDTICDINTKVSCTNLAQSKYSNFAGIPIAILGILGYLSFLALTTALFFNPKNSLLKKSLFTLASIAAVFTFYLIFVEFNIGIFCLGCLVSQISTVAILILS